ncbi:MAG: LON peptidase substrate-binding domain-containing protein [Phycisphaerales bacterium]
MAEMIQINFNRWFPVFPLAGMCLLPHASVPLHIFEPRFVQMIEDSLGINADEDGPVVGETEQFGTFADLADDELDTENEGNGRADRRARRQIALALFRGRQWREDYHGNPPIRPIVCVGQIERHERVMGSRYNILLQGICRARVTEERMPEEGRLYRLVKLTPLEPNPEMNEPSLVGWRSRMRELLDHEALERLRYHSNVVQWFERDDIPSHVLIEIVGHLLMTSADDTERRYHLLSESDAVERAEFVEDQLRRLEREIRAVEPQSRDWPKGLSWN